MLQGLFVAIFIQSIVLGALCFAFAKQNAANIWLGIFMVTIGFQRLFQFVLFSSSWLQVHPLLLISFECSVVAGLFAVHLFVLKRSNRLVTTATLAWLFTTLLLVVGFYSSYYAGIWTDQESYYHQSISTYLNLIVMAYTLYVAFTCIGSIRKASESFELENNQTRFTLGAVRWLLYYWIFRSAIALLFIPIRLSSLHNKAELARLEHGYLLLVNLILILLLAFTSYFALRNPVFFEQAITEAPTMEQQLVLAVLPEQEKQLLATVVQPQEAERYMQLMIRCMEEQKPWLNARLTVAKLGEQTAIPAYKITKVIRQSGYQNFSEFVNHYRILHAKQLLLHPDHQRDTMYAIALDSGFASEAPFYAAFKKATGLSPSAWRETRNNS